MTTSSLKTQVCTFQNTVTNFHYGVGYSFRQSLLHIAPSRQWNNVFPRKLVSVPMNAWIFPLTTTMKIIPFPLLIFYRCYEDFFHSTLQRLFGEVFDWERKISRRFKWFLQRCRLVTTGQGEVFDWERKILVGSNDSFNVVGWLLQDPFTKLSSLCFMVINKELNCGVTVEMIF